MGHSKQQVMKKLALSIVVALALLPVSMFGQSYSALWKQADEAADKDLPKTRIGILEKIEAKARAEKAYGQLLKAGLLKARVAAEVAPDSLRPAVDRLAAQCHGADDPVLKAVCAAVLYRIYTANPDVDDSASVLAGRYKAMAMADVGALARTKADAFSPMVTEGYNGKIFGDDMLSVVGYEVGDFGALYNHYHAAGNRQAACLAALGMIRQHKGQAEVCVNKSEYINWLDSLTHVYSDLDVACEAAIERYRYMEDCPGVTAEQKISYIHYALDKWGGWQNAGQLRNAERELTAPCFTVQMASSVVEPGKAQTMALSGLRNVGSVQMAVYRTALQGGTDLNPANEDDYKKMRAGLQELKDKAQEHRYISHPDYQFFEDSMVVPGLPAGVYMIEVRTSPATETVRWLYYVTDVYLLSHGLPGNRTRYVAVSATTGQPLPGARVRLETEGRYGGKPVAATLTCNADGETVYAYGKRQPAIARAFTDTDRYSPNAWAYNVFSYSSRDGQSEQTRVFTDRSVYRPGQTVHASAVVYESAGGTDAKAKAGRRVKALLRDANFKVVSEKEIVTDGYGTCAADFVLPVGTLNGSFTVFVNNSSARIRVEEYKRPTFKVEFPKINEKYAAGDTLVVRAKALSFAGVPVQGAQVKYTVRRRRSLWWRPTPGFSASSKALPGMDDTELWSGNAVTGADGSFAVTMPMVLPEMPKGISMFYNIVATADVTDVGGETRTGEVSVSIGTKPTAFSCDLPEKVVADSFKTVVFTLRNAAGEPISADVRFRIDGGGEWLSGKTSAPLPVGRRLASGRHRLFAVCETDTIDTEFVAFSLNDTVPCINSRSWFYASATEFPADGRPVTVQVGSSDSTVHIVYCLASGDRIIESGAADVTNRLVNRKFVYKEEYGDGLLLTYAWVKNGQCHKYSATIARPVPDRRLRMAWTTFRDRLTPGQKEEWRLSITNPDGTPAKAQLMATLYDMSLDQVAPHSWSLDVSEWLSLPYAAWLSRPSIGIYQSAEQSWKPFAFRELAVSSFDSSVFPVSVPMLYGYSNIMIRGTRSVKRAPMAMAKAALNSAEAAADMVVEAEQSVALTGAVPAPETASGAPAGGGGRAAGVQVRENLNETAFFYPALETDAEGGVTLKFTLPESLTTWRFIGVAHTKDMLTGTIGGEAVARKDVMVQPNVPRFVRVGDKARITARVINTSERGVGGTARMELIDPETEAVVLSRTQSFAVEAGATAAVAFDCSPDGAQPLLVCRITASGNGFSDGEQHYLPVLPDRERVTVTVPFTQHGAGTMAVRIDTMFKKGASDRKLTIEYTNNPAWLMVQALPYVGTPRDDNAVDLAAAFYANALGRSMALRSPRVKTVFDSWRMEPAGAQSLASSLANNAELKDIVMSETPWVADADRETEQKQRLADFFDESLMQSRMDAAAGKLRALQNPDGSWSWWPDMPGSLSMTVEVAEMLVRLDNMAGRQELSAAMLNKAFGYMDKRFVEQVADMKRAERAGRPQAFPGGEALRYLYLCAVDGRKHSASASAAADYLVALLRKEAKGQSIYDKALTAIVLAKRGDSRLGREYVQSLKEYTVFTEEAGRYYDTPRAAYSWRDYRIPTQVAAMEAIAAITPQDSATLDQMRRWLLGQKRTQAWDTPINSVNAIYAFLAGGTELLESGGRTALAIDGKAIDAPQATAGLGYVKTALHDPKGTTFTATKTSGGTSWGAVYAQFMQDAALVAPSASGISVKREIVADPAGLHVGSRVRVRITIRADRDLDFVQVADRRAACMEPVGQLSGYRNGAYCSPKDNATNYYFDRMSKGTHVVETEYYIDRAGRYETGTCTAGCAYAPEYRATAPSVAIEVKE